MPFRSRRGRRARTPAPWAAPVQWRGACRSPGPCTLRTAAHLYGARRVTRTCPQDEGRALGCRSESSVGAFEQLARRAQAVRLRGGGGGGLAVECEGEGEEARLGSTEEVAGGAAEPLRRDGDGGACEQVCGGGVAHRDVVHADRHDERRRGTHRQVAVGEGVARLLSNGAGGI